MSFVKLMRIVDSVADETISDRDARVELTARVKARLRRLAGKQFVRLEVIQTYEERIAREWNLS